MNAPPRDTSDLEKSLIGTNVFVRKICDWQHAGAFHTAIRAFECGLEMDGPVTILQDDILTCNNFVPYVSRFLPQLESEDLIVSWFDCFLPMRNRMESPRLYGMEPRDFRMTQAATYSRRWAEQIFKYLCSLSKAKPDDSGAHHGDDAYIRDALIGYKKPWHYHSPSLVQHIGLHSLVAPGMPLTNSHKRISNTFVGVEFDVMQWPKLL